MPPGRAQILVDYRSCAPKSGLSQLSATLYGRSFWEQALTHARDLVTETEKLDEGWKKMFDPSITQSNRRDLENTPTASEREAKRLRIKPIKSRTRKY